MNTKKECSLKIKKKKKKQTTPGCKGSKGLKRHGVHHKKLLGINKLIKHLRTNSHLQ